MPPITWLNANCGQQSLPAKYPVATKPPKELTHGKSSPAWPPPVPRKANHSPISSANQPLWAMHAKHIRIRRISRSTLKCQTAVNWFARALGRQCCCDWPRRHSRAPGWWEPRARRAADTIKPIQTNSNQFKPKNMKNGGETGNELAESQVNFSR